MLLAADNNVIYQCMGRRWGGKERRKRRVMGRSRKRCKGTKVKRGEEMKVKER